MANKHRKRCSTSLIIREMQIKTTMRYPLTMLVGIQTSTATKKLEIKLPYDPAIPVLGIHTEETRRERDTCILMFIAALLIIARTWKQPRCPSSDELIRKLWYIYTMEYSVQFTSVAQSCPTLCDPMNLSTPGLPVHHQLLEFTQTHFHRVCDAIQPSHPRSSLSPRAPNPSQHQSLFPMSQLFA